MDGGAGRGGILLEERENRRNHAGEFRPISVPAVKLDNSNKYYILYPLRFAVPISDCLVKLAKLDLLCRCASPFVSPLSHPRCVVSLSPVFIGNVAIL